MIKWIKDFFSLKYPSHIDKIDETQDYTLEELLDLLDKNLELGTGNRIVRRILKKLAERK